MKSHAKALESLTESLVWFARAAEVRLLDVVVTAELRAAALQVIAGAEYLSDNRSPFYILEDGFERHREGWRERVERLRALHEERRRGMAKQGLALPELPSPPAGATDLATFGAQVRQLADARCPPLEGLVVVLAPSRLEDAAAWAASVSHLARAAGLAAVRWIVLDVEQPSVAALASSLGDAAMVRRHTVDEEAARRELAAMVAASAAAPPGAPPQALVGGAFPRGISPPPRPRAVGAALSSASQRSVAEMAGAPVTAGALGPAGALAGPMGQALRNAILGAALAAREGRGAEAARLQRQARDLCLDAGLVREATLLELVLAGYLVRFEDLPAAADVYEAAAGRAAGAGAADLEAQALLGRGALHLVRRDLEGAFETYSRAAQRAVAAGGLALIAIEALRLAGQAAADLGRPDAAARAWQAAVDAAAEASPAEAQASSAAEVARALAAQARKQGRDAQAEALLEQSRRFEAGAVTPRAEERDADAPR